MATFILSAFAAGLLSIVVMPWVTRLVDIAGFKPDEDRKPLGLGLSTGIVLVVLAILAFVFLEIIEILLLQSGFNGRGLASQEYLEPIRADIPVIFLGALFGVLTFYWIYLLMHPKQMEDDSSKRAHAVWGYGLIVLLLIGAACCVE